MAALVNPSPGSKVATILLAPPAILNSISEIKVPSQTVWFKIAGSAPAKTKSEGGTTVISINCVSPIQGLVTAPSVVTVKE